MKIAIYIRVSTYHQIDKDSLPLQRKDLINYSKFILNTNNYEIFEDAGYSAKNTDRPKYQEMIKRVRQGEFSHLLVWKIDRISRNLLDFCDMYEELKKYNCTFVSKNEQFDTSSAMGEAMLKIILVFAELERKLTGERVKAVMIDRASKGQWNGARVPLGYKWDDTIKYPVVDEIEKSTVELIFNKYKELGSTTNVLKLLNANNIKTKRNGSWTTKTLADTIRNPFYKGTYRYNYRNHPHGKIKDEKEWIVLEDNHPGIINKELWQECNYIMDQNAKRNNAKFRDNSKVHVFAGLLECGECGKGLTAKEDSPRLNGFRPSYYVCPGNYNHLGCSQKTISDNIIGNSVFNYVKNIINNTKKLKNMNPEELEKKLLEGKQFYKIIGINGVDQFYFSVKKDKFNLSNSKNNTKNYETDILQKEKLKYDRALSRLEDLFLFDDAVMSEKDYIIKKNTITKKLNEINSKINKTNVPTNNNLEFISLITTKALSQEFNSDNEIDYKELVMKLGKDILKAFVNSIISKIMIKDKKVLSIEFKNGIVNEFIYSL